MNTISTRDLIEERNELKQQILDSFLETFEHYEDQTETFEDILFDEEEIQDWKQYWEDELKQIEEINDLEDEISSSKWNYGLQLIDEDYFEEYTEKLLIHSGYNFNFPSWVQIDWEATANNVKQDYSEVEFRGVTYLYR